MKFSSYRRLLVVHLCHRFDRYGNVFLMSVLHPALRLLGLIFWEVKTKDGHLTINV